MTEPPAVKSRHRLLYVIVVLAAFGLWRLLHRDDRHPWPLPAEPRPGDGTDAPAEEASAESVASSPDPLADLARVLGEDAAPENGLVLSNGAVPEAASDDEDVPSVTTFEHRYAVKWTDRSQDVTIQHEKRDLTLRQAIRDAGWIAQHARRFYTGADGARSPFAELRVYLQCLCGRDVPDLTQPHMIPGESRTCPYSGQSAEARPALGDPPDVPSVGAAR